LLCTSTLFPYTTLCRSGEDALMTYPAWMASEPFALYQKYFTGVFAFLGTENEALGTGADNHHPQFDIDESTLMPGVKMTVAYARSEEHTSEPQSPFEIV